MGSLPARPRPLPADPPRAALVIGDSDVGTLLGSVTTTQDAVARLGGE